MTLYEKIKTIYTQLAIEDFHPLRGTISLQNDSDGKGDYIAELLIDEMLELFPQVDYLINCSMCDGLGWYDNDPYDMDKIECKHENVMYK